jgi:26S proteasome regulatory subunit N5
MRQLLLSLNKKRAQSREATISIVKYGLNDIFPTLDEEEQIKLLKTLVEITEGRIFVEYEFSVAIRRLTEIELKRGNIDEAAKLIQDIQIETFGSLERAYKVEYILFQMKILLHKGDYIRTQIVSNKINRRHLNDEGLEKLKFEFFELMIKFYLNEGRFIDVSKSYKTLYDFAKEIEIKLNNLTPSGTLNEKSLANCRELASNTLKHILFVNYVTFLAICPPELETRNMFNELNLFYKKDLEENTDMLTIVKRRLSDEIVYVDENFLNSFKNYPIFITDTNNVNAEKHFRLFRKFWIQHDLVIFEKYFSQVRLDRIATMVGTNKDEVETELADMVINNYIYAKINRIEATVNFRKKQDGADKLNDLNHDLTKMLEKLETTCHLIHKENLKHDIK